MNAKVQSIAVIVQRDNEKLPYISGLSSTLLLCTGDQYSTKRQLIHNELSITYSLQYIKSKQFFGVVLN
jgi:hypothetical protein